MDDDARRRRLSLPGGGQPRAIAASFHRRFSPSLLLPPVHPAAADARFAPGAGYYYVPPAPVPAASGGGGGGFHHVRSLSQPQFFSMDFLARSPYADLATPAEIPLSLPPPPLPSSDRGASGLPPLRTGAGHRRSKSDILLGFSQPNLQMSPPAPVNPEAPAAEGREATNNNTLEGLLGSHMRPKGLGVLGSSGDGTQERRDHLDSQMRGPPVWSPADSSENEAESADGSMARHCRSLSADSFIVKFNFGAAGQGSSNLPSPSTGAVAAGGLSRSGSGSIGGAAALFTTDLASGQFSESEKKKIMANERLAEIVLTDPKRVKRILNNRVSAAKSKERKVRYMTELERKVQVLQRETATLATQVTVFQRDYGVLSTQNNELKIRLQAMDQQAQLRDALNEALTSEVQRLKIVAGEISDPHMPSGSQQPMSSQMIQLQQLQILKQPSQSQQDQLQSARLEARQQQWDF